MTKIRLWWLEAAVIKNAKVKMLQCSVGHGMEPGNDVQISELAAVRSFRLCLEQANGKVSTAERYFALSEIG